MSTDFENSPRENNRRTLVSRFLDFIEWAGNKLPDPAMLFVWALVITWVLSAVLSNIEFTDIDPRTLGVDASGKPKTPAPIRVENQLTGEALTRFLTSMVTTFTGFHPLGVVLVALLGVGVAEHTGFINAVLKAMLRVTPDLLLTPMLILVAIMSHTAGDTGYVLVIPLGGVIFAAAGRHPLSGIVCSFAGVSGGFSANFIVSALDPLLQGLTQQAVDLLNPSYRVSVLCNYIFLAASSGLIVLVAWYITDRIIEPRLTKIEIDGDPEEMPKMEPLTSNEIRGMIAGLIAMVSCFVVLALACWPENSPLRGPDGSLTVNAPLMNAVVPLIFFLFIIPGIVHGYVSGSVKSHRDIVTGMSKSMSTMGYYLVLAFFASQFIYVFGQSNLGALVAIKGADFVQALGLPGQVTIIGVILLTTMVNLLIGSASAKWALLAPIFVPMMMQLGLAPELTQAAFRVGDSSTNIITPLMPYFPLVVVYCQRYVKNTGIGTLISLMLPYSICFLITWTVLLMIFWQFNLPLGIPTNVGFTYTPPGM